MIRLLLAVVPWCSTACAAPTADHVVLRGGQVVGQGQVDVELRDGRIVGVGQRAAPGAAEVDVAGRWIAPAFIDSHVHLAYLKQPEQMADGGIAAAVDLAAPLSFLPENLAPLRVVHAGPMITATGGYPTRSWGAGGYGLECADGDQAEAAVATVAAAGAAVAKLPVTSEPVLGDEPLRRAASAAHERGMRTVSHALDDDTAARARTAGIQALAHTPVGPLSEATLSAWGDGGAVISTLAAFGGSQDTMANLQALRAAGAVVLYGTDFGNTRTAGIDGAEIALMQKAGMDGAAILDAGTAAPAAWWGLTELGSIEAGKAASLLVRDADPRKDPSSLSRPVQVWLDGIRR